MRTTVPSIEAAEATAAVTRRRSTAASTPERERGTPHGVTSTPAPSTKGYIWISGWHPRCYDLSSMKPFLATEELCVPSETDTERIGTRADADTERLSEEDF